MTNVIGIDISKHQGRSVDFKKIVNDPIKPQFVYMRGTVGANSLDSLFETFYPKALDSGLKVGMYHLCWPPNDVRAELDDILEQLAIKHFDLPVALDAERLTSIADSAVAKRVLELAMGLEAAGVKPIIYTGAWWWNPNVPANSYWKSLDVWAASYTSSVIVPRDWQGRWRIWQKTSSYKMQGITENTVDVNEFNGDQAAFDSWLSTKSLHPSGTEPLLGG